MSVATAELIWTLVAGYFALGVCVALLMVFGWLARIDQLAGSAPLRVRLLLFPGLAAFWPLMLARLRKPKAAL